MFLINLHDVWLPLGKKWQLLQWYYRVSCIRIASKTN